MGDSNEVAMPSATQPPNPVGSTLQLRVRTIDGGLVTLKLSATDHRIVIGEDCDYLVGNGMLHAFSKDGVFIRSAVVPALLKGLQAIGEAVRVEGYTRPHWSS